MMTATEQEQFPSNDTLHDISLFYMQLHANSKPDKSEITYKNPYKLDRRSRLVWIKPLDDTYRIGLYLEIAYRVPDNKQLKPLVFTCIVGTNICSYYEYHVYLTLDEARTMLLDKGSPQKIFKDIMPTAGKILMNYTEMNNILDLEQL